MIEAVKLPTSLKIFHGMGSIAYGVKDNGFSVFLLIFYNQVLGIDAGVVGFAIMAALIFDAFIDPFIGELTDRTQTRWGRRLPWLYLAPLPLAIAWLALWHPPEVSQTMQIVWLIGFAIIVRSLVAACEVPSVALVPELTGDYHERTRLMRFRFLFGWAGGLALMILAYGFIFTGEDAVTKPEGYSSYAILGAVMMAGSVIISAIAQHRRVAHPSPPLPARAGGLTDVFSEMKKTLSNRAFLALLMAAVFAFVSQAIQFSTTNYLMIYVWRLDLVTVPTFGFQLTGLTLYGLSLFASVVLAFLFVSPVSEKLGKREGAIVSLWVSLVIFMVIYGAWLLRLFPGSPDAPNPWLLFLLVNIANSFAIVTMILNSSMMADVVEASQSETGRRSEGLFFAGYFFMQKCAVGIGIFCSGLILTFAAFPAKAEAGKVAMPILNNMVIGYIAATFMLGIAYAVLLRRFPITKNDHDERIRQLASRSVKPISDESDSI